MPLFSSTSLCIHMKQNSYALFSTWKKQLAYRFNLTYRYINDVLSINNRELENYLDHMYPAELEIKDTTESITLASYLDLLLLIGTCRYWPLYTSIYDKRDDFNFYFTHPHLLSSNFPSPAITFLSLSLQDTPGCNPHMNYVS